MAIKLFTWNMQRGATSATAYSLNSDDGRRVNLRYGLLQDLCDGVDFGCIIEPGPNIRASIKNRAANRPLPNGHCYMDQQPDTQSDLSACRPILYSAAPSRYQVGTPIHSGKLIANRFPVGQQYYYGGHKLVVVALHATSGQSGSSNTRAIIQSYIDYMDGEDAGGLIVGGDFNAHLDEQTTAPNGRLESRYVMPDQPTNQSAPPSRPGGIDGFFFYTNHDASRPIEFAVHRPQRYVDVYHGTSEFHTTAHLPQEAGFWLEEDSPPQGGVSTMYRLSDHCPVMITVGLKLMRHNRRSGSLVQEDAV